MKLRERSARAAGWVATPGGGSRTDGPVSIGTTLHLGEYTVANLPAAVSGNANHYCTVTDGTTSTDVTVGGGTSRVLARSTGSTWESVAGSGGTSVWADDGDGTVSLTTKTQADIKYSQNGATGLYVENVNTGTGAYAQIAPRNANNAAGFNLMALGTNYTTAGGFVQDSGVLSADTLLSGGISIISRADAPIRFYANGHANQVAQLDKTGLTLYAGNGSSLVRKFANVTANVTATPTCTLATNIPAGSRIISSAIQVSSALATGETWDAELNDGSSVQAICIAQSVALNTEHDALYTGIVTDATTNIVITRNGGGSFTAQGSFRAVVWYEYQTPLTDL